MQYGRLRFSVIFLKYTASGTNGGFLGNARHIVPEAQRSGRAVVRIGEIESQHQNPT